MLPHYFDFAKVRTSFGISGRKCKQKCNMHWFLNSINFNALSLLTYLLFQFPVPVKYSNVQQTILSKRVLWTEAAFSACLAWHWRDHHWQCNRRVAWTSSRMYADRRRTLRATIVTMFSDITRDVSVLSNMTRFYIVSWKLPQIRTSKFRKVVRQHAEGILVLLEIYFSFSS